MDQYLYQPFLWPEEDGGYTAEFPDLPGCVSFGETFMEAVEMAEDAAKTWVAAQLKGGGIPPTPIRHDPPEGVESVYLFFHADPSYIVDGPVVSAAEAARRLEVSPGRITRMLDAGILEGYRSGRHTWITEASIRARKKQPIHPGRPRRAATG